MDKFCSDTISIGIFWSTMIPLPTAWSAYIDYAAY